MLARIDPTLPIRRSSIRRSAKKAQDEAQLANARIDLERYEKLAATNAINKQQADTQRALVAQYIAQVQADQAAIDNARRDARATPPSSRRSTAAPASGMVDEGNIVRASDAAPAIVVITQVKPISVLFNLPQQDLQQVNAAFAKGPLPASTRCAPTPTK